MEEAKWGPFTNEAWAHFPPSQLRRHHRYAPHSASSHFHHSSKDSASNTEAAINTAQTPLACGHSISAGFPQEGSEFMNIKMRDLKHVGGDFFFLPRRTQIELMWLAVLALSLPFPCHTHCWSNWLTFHLIFSFYFTHSCFGALYRSCWKLATFIGVDKYINAADYS